MDRPRIDPYKRGGVPNRTQIVCLVFFDTMVLSEHIERVSVSRMRDFYGIGATISIGRESWCFPYAGFLIQY